MGRNDWRIKQMKSWKDLFRTHILERGLNYYEEGYVTSLEQNLTGYTAVVVGTENYDVEIEILDNRVYDMKRRPAMMDELRKAGF